MPQLAFNTYGKTGVRLTQVMRKREHHEVVELSVRILFEGDFGASFTAADNSSLLPTDTMKNSVYALARQKPVRSIESFAADLAFHHLNRLPHVNEITVEIEQTPWSHIGDYRSAFVQTGNERRFVSLNANRTETLRRSGLLNLEILKTAHSGFSGFLKDELTTLPETDDRLLGTVLDADWSYFDAPEPDSVEFNRKYELIRELLLDAFARHESLSVQHTLYAMAAFVIAEEPCVKDIHLVMPNKHRLLVDLSRFSLDNPNQIFVPTDEPSGYIEANVTADRTNQV